MSTELDAELNQAVVDNWFAGKEEPLYCEEYVHKLEARIAELESKLAMIESIARAVEGDST